MAKVKIEAPNLSLDQLREGVELGLFAPADYAASPGGGWVITVDAAGGMVQAILAFINEPPATEEVAINLQTLSDKYLTLKACYETLDAPPMNEEDDAWCKLRACYLSRMHAAKAALEAAGGPV